MATTLDEMLKLGEALGRRAVAVHAAGLTDWPEVVARARAVESDSVQRIEDAMIPIQAREGYAAAERAYRTALTALRGVNDCLDAT